MKKIYSNFTIDSYLTGHYKVETEDGHSVRILDTQVKGHLCVAAAIRYDSSEILVAFDAHGRSSEEWLNLRLYAEQYEAGDYVAGIADGSDAIYGILAEPTDEAFYEAKLRVLYFPAIGQFRFDCTYGGFRLADASERLLLDRALNNIGKRWDADSRTLLDIEEDAPRAKVREFEYIGKVYSDGGKEVDINADMLSNDNLKMILLSCSEILRERLMD